MSKPAYDFLPEKEYDEIGLCMYVAGDFCTFMHKTPCTASVSSTMDMNGWKLYTQPLEFWSPTFNVGRRSFIATYVKRNRENG